MLVFRPYGLFSLSDVFLRGNSQGFAPMAFPHGRLCRRTSMNTLKASLTNDRRMGMSRIPFPSKPPIQLLGDTKAKQEFCKSGFRSVSWKSILFIGLAFIVFLAVLYFVG